MLLSIKKSKSVSDIHRIINSNVQGGGWEVAGRSGTEGPGSCLCSCMDKVQKSQRKGLPLRDSSDPSGGETLW